MLIIKAKSILIFLILTILTSNKGIGQAEGQLIEKSLDINIPYTVKMYNTKNGLIQNQVTDILQLPNNKVLLSTANGIMEFDGNTFKSINAQQTTQNYWFYQLFYSAKDEMLFGRIENDLYHIGKTDNIKLKYKLICFNGNQTFAITKNGNIDEISLPSFQIIKSYSTQMKNPNSFEKHGPYFYYSNDSILLKYNLKTHKTDTLLEGSFGSSHLQINKNDNNLFFHTNRFLYKISHESPYLNEIFRIEENDQTSGIFDLEFIGSDTYFIGTNSGLWFKNPTITVKYTKKNALPSNFIYSLKYYPEENVLFVGTGEKGLLELQLKNCLSYYIQEGLNEQSYTSVTNYKNKILIGENYQFIYELKEDTAIRFSEHINSYASLSIIHDSIFAGTWGNGLQVFYGNKIVKQLNSKNIFASNTIVSAFLSSRKEIWIGTTKGVSKGTHSGNLKPAFANEIKESVIKIFERKNGDICLGGSNGFYIIESKNQRVIHYDQKKGLICKEVRAFYEDEENRLWIGTYNGGIYCYDQGKLTSINSKKGCFLDQDAFCLALDKYGYFLITSNHGLWRIKKNDLIDFYEGKLDYLIPFYYSEENGILNTEFNGGSQNNYCKIADNEFCFPNIQGIVRMRTTQYPFRKLIPEFTQISVDDELISDKHVFERTTKNISFQVSVVNYSKKYNVYYQYKLTKNGTHSNWSTPQKNNFISFNFLPPGDYVLKIRALDGFNDRKPHEIIYKFSVLPYFYEKNSFRVLMVICFLILTIFIGRMRVQSYRRKAEEKEKYKRLISEFELKAIQARMNPHFIFNTLNTIKYYVSINEKSKADAYIDVFSVFLRDFLENSRNESISIKKEIKMITDYLKIEENRYSYKFETLVDIPENLLEVQIPSFLIQPFIENSIKHGLHHSEKNEKHIYISFVLVDSDIICIIEDNGIGRKKSAELNSLSYKHESIGMSLVNDKIKLLTDLYQQIINIKVYDKYDEKGNACGTIVIITIPIKKNENHNR